MMELNREQIIQALEYCTGIKGVGACANCPACLGCNDCVDFLREESLALIKELIDSEDYWKRQTFDACMDKGRMHDKIKELTKESQKWQEAYDCADSACRELSSKCDELTEENEKLNERINREARCQYDLCGQIVTLRDDVKYIKAETVRKMQERLKNYLREVADGDIGYGWIDQIAKELLEENNV